MLKNLFEKFKFRLKKPRWSDFERDQKTYILPTRFGLIYGGVCLVLFLMSFIYGNNLTYLYTFFLISLGVSSMHITNRNVDRFKFIHAHCEPFFAGETTSLSLLLNNHQPVDLFNLELEIPFIKNSRVKVAVLPAQSHKEVISQVSSNERGYLNLPRVLVESDYPFSMLRSWKKISLYQKTIVYPKKEGEALMQNNKFADQVGQIKNKQYDGTFIQHRPFTPSDSFKRVDWKAYARSRNLLVQQKENPQTGSIEISFDDVKHLNEFEKKISQLCLWVFDCQKLNVPVQLNLGVWSNNTFAADSYVSCYEALALIKESDVKFYQATIQNKEQIKGLKNARMATT